MFAHGPGAGVSGSRRGDGAGDEPAGFIGLHLIATDADESTGDFFLSGIPPGPYLVAAFTDGSLTGWPDRRVVEAAAQGAKLVLLEEGRIVAVDLVAQYQFSELVD